MGVSSSSLLDESKCNYIRGRTEAELKNFSPHYKRQYTVAFLSQLQDEVEQHHTSQTQLLKQKEPRQASDVIYKDNVLLLEDAKKWKERFVVVRGNYSLEIHDSQETFTKGAPARHTLLPTGGTVLTSEEQYSALVDKTFPDLNSSKDEGSAPLVSVPGPFPVYLSLPYRRDAYFSFQEEDKQIRFISVLSDCIRHQNHDSLKQKTCDAQAFLKAIHFYRQEKGHYESWQMLLGTDAQVLANQVMEDLLPTLQTELLPRLKGKKAERKRVWFSTVEATYELVQEQLKEGLQSLKEECKEAAKQQEALIRSNMDQITTSRTFLETKLQGLVSEPAAKFCSESVAPYLASILEELMGPVSSGFQAVRQRLEAGLSHVCKEFPPGGSSEDLTKALEEVAHGQLEDCYQHVNVLKEQLQELRNRFKFSNTTLLVHTTQSHMQQLMENAVHTFETLLQSAIKEKPEKLTPVMEKAKLRVLKQYDYDSSTVRKIIFQDALVDITLPAIMRDLAPTCKTELQNYEQYIFDDYTNFIQVENIYEDLLLNILNNEVNKVVKEAASLKKHNLFVDSTDLQCISQSSLSDSRTPPRSAPSSPAKVPPPSTVKQTPEQHLTVPGVGNGCLEGQPSQNGEAISSEKKVSAEPPPTIQVEEPAVASDLGSPVPEVTLTTPDTTLPKTDAPETSSPSPCVDSTPEVPSSTASAMQEASSPEGSSGEVLAEAEPEAQSEAVASTLAAISLQATASEDAGSSPEQPPATDRAVYLIPPAGMTAGAPVPPAEESESEPPTCSEVPDPAEDQPRADDGHADSQPSQTEAQTPEDTAPQKDAVAETFSSEEANGIPVVPGLPAEGADSPKSAPAEPEVTADHSSSEEPETEDALDSIRAIRDLVVEIIEVEDIVTPCPDTREAQ